MLNLECRTKLSRDEVIGHVKRFFGEGGLGLELTEETPECISFVGGGGYVNAIICPEERETRVDLVTQEWDYQVKEFASRLP